MSRPSKPFSNGGEEFWWMEQFCERCNKYKTDGFGSILEGSCEIAKALQEAYFDETKRPQKQG